MTTIDQRIMIPAPIESVWAVLTDPASISQWDQTARQVTPLNHVIGVGARRRCVDVHGKSRVEEVTAWLIPLGYEYRTIEGIYKSYGGRMRLQAVPDGTQLQWTVTYQLGGTLGGVRDSLGYQRTLRAEMADSLRALRNRIESSGIHFTPSQHAKVTMQADPGFEARRARAGSAAAAASRLSDLTEATRVTATPTATPPNRLIVSDPLARPIDLSDPDSDLPPIEAVQAAAQPATNYAPPVTLYALPTVNEPPIAEEDTRQRTASKPSASPVATPAPIAAISTANDDTPPRSIRREETPSTIIARRDPPTPITTPPPTPVPIEAVERPVSAPSITDQPEAPLPTGTADASVWDVFGITPPVTRPRNELDSLIVDLRTPPPAQPISVTRAFDRPVPIVPPESHVPDAADNSPIAGSVKFIPVQSIGKATVRVRRVDTQKRQIKATIRVRRL